MHCWQGLALSDLPSWCAKTSSQTLVAYSQEHTPQFHSVKTSLCQAVIQYTPHTASGSWTKILKTSSSLSGSWEHDTVPKWNPKSQPIQCGHKPIISYRRVFSSADTSQHVPSQGQELPLSCPASGSCQRPACWSGAWEGHRPDLRVEPLCCKDRLRE